MIVSWGDKIAKGSRCDVPVMMEDFYPTILELAGIKEYETVQEIDGYSIVPLFMGEEAEIDENRKVLSHFPHQWRPEVNEDIDYMTALRKGDWKLIYRHRTQELELYNLADDLSEKNNLAEQNPEILAEMAQAMTAELKEKEALMPTFRATGEAIPYPDQLVNRR
jgi:arylsulfatase A-like enzyme